mgnify:CR=1 FL=1|tara:strand:- start:189 stop:611 length:423 start_codon:yes stop_codon:yes gene_type:complete
MNTSTDSYNVPTKAESMRADQTQDRLMSLVRFMVAHFNTAALSNAQRRIVARLAAWEAVEVQCAFSGRSLYVSAIRNHNLATFSVGPRGGIKGTLHHWCIKDTKISGRGAFRSVRSHVREPGEWRALNKRVKHQRARLGI